MQWICRCQPSRITVFPFSTTPLIIPLSLMLCNKTCMLFCMCCQVPYSWLLGWSLNQRSFLELLVFLLSAMYKGRCRSWRDMCMSHQSTKLYLALAYWSQYWHLNNHCNLVLLPMVALSSFKWFKVWFPGPCFFPCSWVWVLWSVLSPSDMAALPSESLVSSPLLSDKSQCAFDHPLQQSLFSLGRQWSAMWASAPLCPGALPLLLLSLTTNSAFTWLCLCFQLWDLDQQP